jgi:2-hydroxychromene-2-carboxylate isomerase
MAAALDFYFDFTSPYGYLASTKIDALAARHGREVKWRPMLLGAALKVTGQPPLPSIPMKGDYSKHDFQRSARYHGIAYRPPSVFPVAMQAPMRTFYWLDATDPVAAKALAARLFHAYFVDDVNISNPSDTIRIAASLGHDAAELQAALDNPAVKEKAKAEGDAAIARGVFGSPFVFVDDEPFWGLDRFDQIERWLELGGF